MIKKNQDNALSSTGQNLTRPIFILLILLMAGSTSIYLLKIAISILKGYNMDPVAGVWTGLSIDLAKGEFYRPLFSESMGFGGTRYFPLFFSLQALLLKITGRPILSGQILNFSTCILLMIGFYFLLRRLGVGSFLALVPSLFLLSEPTVQLAFEGIRADIFPIALNLFGLAFYLSKRSGKYREFLAALFFTLAFSAKMTAVHGIASLFLWLFINGRYKEAFRVSFLTVAGYLVFFGIFDYATSGRIIEILKACASNGMTLSSLVMAPIRFINEFRSLDTYCLLLVFGAIAVIGYQFRTVGFSLQTIFFGVSLLITAFLFSSPGIGVNQLVDVATASLLVIGSTVFNRDSKNIRAPIFAYAVLILISVTFTLTDLKFILTESTKPYCRPKMVDLIKQKGGDVISEDTSLTILAGKTSYVLDPFIIRPVIQKDESRKEKLFKMIEQKDFSAFIFIQDPKVNNWWYSIVYGPEMVSQILSSYKEEQRCGDFIVYSPK